MFPLDPRQHYRCVVFSSEDVVDSSWSPCYRAQEVGDAAELLETLGIATRHRPNGRIVIRLATALDATGASRSMDESGQVDPQVGEVVVRELEDVTSGGAAGIGALCDVDGFVRARRGELVIGAPSRRVMAVVEAAGLADRVLRDGESADDTDATGRGPRRLAAAVDGTVWR